MTLQQQGYPHNGSQQVQQDADPLNRVLPKRPSPTEVLEVLRSNFGVPEWLCDRLVVAFRNATARVVDNAVDQRHRPQPYSIIRQIDGDG